MGDFCGRHHKNMGWRWGNIIKTWGIFGG
jgi:hypothetical protein